MFQSAMKSNFLVSKKNRKGTFFFLREQIIELFRTKNVSSLPIFPRSFHFLLNYADIRQL